LESKEGHRKRLREKFLKAGLQGLLDYEIIELLLTLGTPRKDCKRQAKDLIKRFKSVRGVLEAEREEIEEVKGIGPHNIFGLKLMHEVARFFLREKMMSKPACHSSKEVFDYLYHALRDVKKEMFKVMLLDSKNQIIEEKTFFEGTVDSSAVYPREIIKQALRYGACSLIFVHNHPSGDPEPSLNDKEITKELVLVSSLLQIRVLDHIIIGDNRYFSFADKGLIEKYELLLEGLRRNFR